MSQDDGNPYRPHLFFEPYQSAISNDLNQPSGSNGEKLVVLATFSVSIDAHRLRNLLHENGIGARVDNEASTSLLGGTIAGPSSAFWIEVVIRESDVEAALAITKQFLESQSTDESAIPEWLCSCGETVDAGFLVCWNCEAEFRGQQEPEDEL